MSLSRAKYPLVPQFQRGQKMRAIMRKPHVSNVIRARKNLCAVCATNMQSPSMMKARPFIKSNLLIGAAFYERWDAYILLYYDSAVVFLLNATKPLSMAAFQ